MQLAHKVAQAQVLGKARHGSTELKALMGAALTKLTAKA